MTAIYLETRRLMMREFTASDIEKLVELDGDPDVMRFLTGGKPTSRQEIENSVLPWIFETYRRFPGYGRWAAIDKDVGEFVGWFALGPHDDRPRDEVELGYRLRKSVWGKGFATEGSRALVHNAFTELGAGTVFATTMTVNTASRRVMEKAGLKFVRTFFAEWPEYIDGAEFGDVEYALTKEEWAKINRR